MRLTLFCIFLFIAPVLKVSGQIMNYQAKQVKIQKVFDELKKQTDYRVFWNTQKLRADRLIDVNFKNASPTQVVDDILKDLPFTYTLIGKIFVVKSQEAIAAESITADTLAVHDLREVAIVSTGYQHIPAERATGSFSRVDTMQFNRKVGPDVLSRMEGITSGLLFNKNTLNTTTGNLDLSIRGRSTIYANDQPLVILNDFPFNGDFNAINPNDVENITVLKDAAAASIWGVRAGNGVIVMNTKKGKYQQPLSLNLNTNLTISGKPDVFYNPNYLSSSDFIEVETYLFGQGKYDDALADQTNYPVVSPVVQILDRQRKGQSAAATNAQLDALRTNDARRDERKYFYQNQVAQQYFFNLSKGTARSNHYLSAGYDRALLNLVNNTDNRISLNTRHSVQLLKNLELSASLSYIRSLSKVDSTIGAMISPNFTPYFQYKDAAGNANGFPRLYSNAFNAQAMNNGFLDWSYVPLKELAQAPLVHKGNDLRLNGGIKYTLLPGLSAEVKFQYQQISNNSELVRTLESSIARGIINNYSILTDGKVNGYNIPLGNVQYLVKRNARGKNFRTQLNYQKDWDKHAISVIAGYEISEFDTEAYDSTNYGYEAAKGRGLNVDTSTIFNLFPSGSSKINVYNDLFGILERIRSFYANAAYTYAGKYTFSASARMDASNYFGVKTRNRQVPLWSTGALWHLDREDFFHADWLSILTLRASHGYNGNLDRTITGITTFKNNTLRATYSGLPFSNIINIGNPELRWERIAITNFGLDFGFKNQAISGRLEYYLKHGSDMLGDKAFPSSAGIKVLRGNYSEMKSRGMDLVLTGRNPRGLLKWQSSLLLSTALDRVTLYDVVETDNAFYVGINSVRPVLGRPVYGIYSYKWAGLDPEKGAPRGFLNGEISTDYPKILTETPINELQYHGAARPTVFGGLNNTFSMYKFTLGFNISYKLGYYFRKPSVDYSEMFQSALGNGMNADFSKRWQKPGDELHTNVPAMGNYGDTDERDRFYQSSSITVGKGDHIRLQDVSLSFDLDRSNWKNIPLKNAQLYFYASNLGIIWKANDFGLDPDLIPDLANRLSAPVPRSFSMGIKANF